jgi:TPR repeat protein
MKYRVWDFYLPFFAGFNYAYFLKDYENAAKYYKRAADLNGDPLFANLAGRYMYESRQTNAAIAYLAAMEKGARSDAIKKSFRTRLTALLEVKKIETALDAYRREHGETEASVGDLLTGGYLQAPPVDPYGGQFFIDSFGQVRTTSKFAFSGGTPSENQGH